MFFLHFFAVTLNFSVPLQRNSLVVFLLHTSSCPIYSSTYLNLAILPSLPSENSHQWPTSCQNEWPISCSFLTYHCNFDSLTIPYFLKYIISFLDSPGFLSILLTFSLAIRALSLFHLFCFYVLCLGELLCCVTSNSTYMMMSLTFVPFEWISNLFLNIFILMFNCMANTTFLNEILNFQHPNLLSPKYLHFHSYLILQERYQSRNYYSFLPLSHISHPVHKASSFSHQYIAQIWPHVFIFTVTVLSSIIWHIGYCNSL